MKTQPVTVIDGPLPPGIWDRADMEPQLVTAPSDAVVREFVGASTVKIPYNE